MNIRLYYLLFGAVVVAIATSSTADITPRDVTGIWQTETSDEGYLHVSFDACEDKVCGTIVAAFNKQDQQGDDFEHLGKLMIWDMQSSGRNNWSGGKIWDPTKNKIYKSKMKLAGDTLKVSGCVAIFCRSQLWKSVR